jgi:hypothetical protein
MAVTVLFAGDCPICDTRAVILDVLREDVEDRTITCECGHPYGVPEIRRTDGVNVWEKT